MGGAGCCVLRRGGDLWGSWHRTLSVKTVSLCVWWGRCCLKVTREEMETEGFIGSFQETRHWPASDSGELLALGELEARRA